ncbi:hypothetical protein LINPERHAP1_LOCUS41719 [Linum perenne]
MSTKWLTLLLPSGRPSTPRPKRTWMRRQADYWRRKKSTIRR